jgi:glucosamine--fructose-6-phosphate aminotransferase (isomerizing)
LNYQMIDEARQSPAVVRQRLVDDYRQIEDIAEGIRRFQPSFVATIARGSSDHAASFLAYVISSRLGLLCSSLSPSLVTLHGAALNFKNCLALAVSQSGASPDLGHALQKAHDGGAFTVAIVNQLQSPLEQIAQKTLRMGAGEEKGIAATKTFISSLVSGLLLLAEWDKRVCAREDFDSLPDLLEQALSAGDSPAWNRLERSANLIVLSRGLGFPIAQEIALKFNEVCRLHALAYSGAEFSHGPMALIRPGDPVLLIGVRGPELASIQATATLLKGLGADLIFLAPEGTEGATISYPRGPHILFDPIIAVQTLYPVIARIAAIRGYNPDQPSHLQKVTRTL